MANDGSPPPRPEGGTVAKALDVLDLVAGFGRPVRFSELQERSDLPKATLYRLCQTLAGQGMLVVDADTGRYALGMRLVRLAHAAWTQASLGPIARPFLDALVARTGRVVHLAQLDAGHVLYIDKRVPSRPPAMYSAAGRVGPAYCTGVGKAMLAHLAPAALEAALAEQGFAAHTAHTITDAAALRRELARVRERGHAFDAEEHEPGIVCIAMPVLTPGGRALGAISVTGNGTRDDLPALEAAHLGALAEAVRGTAEAARAWRFDSPDGPMPEGAEP